MKENSAHGFTEGSDVPKEQNAAHSFEKKTPSWYTADEMYHWLIREKYSEVIAKELCQKWSEDLQGAFNKGYEKSVKELTRLRSELQQERDKARNQAIQDCIDKFQELSGHYIKQSYVEIFTAHFESLKTKP